MKQRGRQSAASALMSDLKDKTDVVARPDASYDLTDEQAEEWWAIVNRMPADWFPRETHGVLAQLVRAIVRARNVAHMIDKRDRSTRAMDLKTYTSLLRMEAQLSRTIASLSTKLRITQQSQNSHGRKPGRVRGDAPWDTDDEE